MAKMTFGADGRVAAPAGSAPGSAVAAPGQPGVAQKVANKGTNGSDPRFSVAGLQKVGNTYVDGAGNVFDDGGRMISGNWGLLEDTPGLPPSNQSESYDVYAGTTTSYSGGSGGGGGGGGGDASSNPYFNQLKSSFQAQSAADLTKTKAALQQALIQFGLVPGNFQDKLGVLDNLTKDLIAKNTDSGISTYARLLEQKGDAQKALVNRLQASGLRRSGAKGYKMRRGQLDWDRLFQDSLAQLSGHTSGLYEGYASNEQARQQQLMSQMASMNFGGSGSGIGQNSGGGGGYNPYVVTQQQIGSTANGGTQQSLANFIGTGLGSSTGGAVTAPIYSGGGSSTHKAM